MQRREALATTGAALSAALVGLTRTSSAKPQPHIGTGPEHPWKRVRRLAAELSRALADPEVIDWAEWYAIVHPAHVGHSPVTFYPVETVPGLAAVIDGHRTAYAALVKAEADRVNDSDFAVIVAAEMEAFERLLVASCPTHSAVLAKVAYLRKSRPCMAETNWTAAEVATFLSSFGS